jgi:cytochrome c551/c552
MKMNKLFSILAALIFVTTPFTNAAEKKAKINRPAPLNEKLLWSPFIETNFPFYSSVLDARNLGPGWPTNNLTPRGIILNLGHDCWACFDTELLRMAAIWNGKGISPLGMAQASYQIAGAKVPDGQEKLPQIIGTPWLANGIYPGWQSSGAISLADPRPPCPDPTEIGRGPLTLSQGQFKAIRFTQAGVSFEYEVAGTSVEEKIEARMQNEGAVVQRSFRLLNVKQPLWLLVGRTGPGLEVEFNGRGTSEANLTNSNDLLVVQVPASKTLIEFSIAIGMGRAKPWFGKPNQITPESRWPQTVTTHATLSTNKDAYVLDNISLPLDNPWKRNVRLADIAFFKDGRAAAVTFDGDVWLISGLKDDLREIQWKRFTSGLHEPLSIGIRDEEIFVFDRNGIWRLRDTDGNGEADVHELFSNAFAQTAETREYANGMRIAPDGSFIIAKGGQQGTTTGKDNGKVMRISADGKTATILGWGLRQPFIGVNPKTGLVTASDQQGHYVPSTPLHIIRDNQFYGFLSALLPKEIYPAPIADPLTWIPHSISASGAGQVWLSGAKMGPLNDALILIDYYRPELLLVLENHRVSKPQAAIVSLARDFEFAPLTGAVNPADGQLYIAGFQIWGTTAKQVSGLARLRYTGAPSTLPREVVPMDKGILLRFDVALDPKKAVDPANFSVERWNYQRTFNYGSPHFKLDSSKGQDAMTPSSAYVSKDGKSVFIGIPDMKPVMQMRLGWALTTQSGAAVGQNAYFTPYELSRFNPAAEGFEPLTVDLTPRTANLAAETPITVEEGKRLSELMGCAACHSVDGSTLGKVGPSWKGLFRSEVAFADGSKTLANEDYLRQSIREPAVKIVSGFDKSDAGMPSYEGVISDPQIEALILYIKTLR